MPGELDVIIHCGFMAISLAGSYELLKRMFHVDGEGEDATKETSPNIYFRAHGGDGSKWS